MRVNKTKKAVKVTGEKKPKIHNVFIVDASGSMGGSKYNNAIKGLNNLLTSIISDKDSDNTVTIVEFEGNFIKQRVLPTHDVPNVYFGMGVGGNTPLNQAIGETLEFIALERANRFNTDDKVLVNVFTDGGENASKGKYSDHLILSEYMKELRENGFTITLVGTENVVHYAVDTLGLASTNTLVHNNTALGIFAAFSTTLKSRALYSKSVANGEDVKMDFYSKSVE